MRIFFALGLVNLLASPAFATEAKEHRPFSEMKGGCDRFREPMQAEFAAWEKEGMRIASATSNAQSPALPLGKKIDLQLIEQSKVAMAAKPEKVFANKGASFGGLAKIVVPSDGSYRVSLGGKIWVDLVDEKTGKIVSASKFEMQTGCEKIFKVVEFALKAGHPYVLQISSNSKPSALVLISSALK